MAKIDIQKRLDETFDFAFKLLMKDVKKNGVRIAEIQKYNDPKRKDIMLVSIETDCPMWVAETLGYYIRISNHGNLRNTSVHPGYYDWDSDTYFKDAASVEFSV